MQNKKKLYLTLGFRQITKKNQAKGSCDENSNTSKILKKIYPKIYSGKFTLFCSILHLTRDRDHAYWKFKKSVILTSSGMNLNKKRISNSWRILNLVIKRKDLLKLILKKISIPKKTFQLKKCFRLRKKLSLMQLRKTKIATVDFHFKNLYINHKYTSSHYNIEPTQYIKKNQPLTSTAKSFIKKYFYNLSASNKKLILQKKNFHNLTFSKNKLLLNRWSSVQAQLVDKVLLSNASNYNTQQTTRITYYHKPISRIFKTTSFNKKIKNQHSLLSSSHRFAKKNNTQTNENKKIIGDLVKQTSILYPQIKINTAINNFNSSSFAAITDKVMRLKSRMQNQSLSIFEKTYELLNNKTSEEKKIIIINKQLYDIKRDIETLLQFSKKIATSNILPIEKTYTYDFL